MVKCRGLEPIDKRGAGRLDFVATIGEAYSDVSWGQSATACRSPTQMNDRRPAMPLQHLEHFLIQTADLEKTKAWYVDVLGMRVGPHPDFKFPVYWLYLGDTDVLHITEGGTAVSENRKQYLGQQSTVTQGSGVVDHVAFRATGLLDMIARLDKKGVD